EFRREHRAFPAPTRMRPAHPRPLARRARMLRYARAELRSLPLPRQATRVDNAQRLVREFHEAFALPAPERPTLDGFPGDLRVRLTRTPANDQERTHARQIIGA